MAAVHGRLRLDAAILVDLPGTVTEAASVGPAYAALPPAYGRASLLARRAMLAVLSGALEQRSSAVTLRTCYRQAAGRAGYLARIADKSAADAKVVFPGDGGVPGGLLRLADGEEIAKRYVGAVRTELRRQEATWDVWAAAYGIYQQLAGGHRFTRTSDDPAQGWRPGFETSGAILRIQYETFDAAGQQALDQLGASVNFALEDPTIRREVGGLLLDQVAGIDETTVIGLRRVLVDNVGNTISEIGQAVEAYWDQAALVRGIRIAVTEMARASARAEVVTYRANDVAQVEFAGGAGCPICNALLGSRYAVDSEETHSLIPAHPACTHLWSPVIEPGWSLPTLPWSGQER